MQRTWPIAACLSVLLTAGMLAAPRGDRGEQSPTQGMPDTEAWLTDAEGRQYRLDPLPRVQGQKVSDTRVRTIWGVEADLAREDAQFFYLKAYRVLPVAPPPTPAPPPVPTEALPASASRVTFTPLGTGLPEVGQWREGVAVGDLTGDGRPEIVAGPARKSFRGPTVFALSGTTWSATPQRLPDRPYDYGHLALSVDPATRQATIAFGVHLQGLLALRQAAPGQFADASEGLPFAGPGTPAFSSRAVALADCNGDGRSDLLALGEGLRPGARGAEAGVAMGLRAWTAAADGRWEAHPQEASLKSLFGSRLATGDVDGDGHVDLAVASGQFADGRVILRGDGRCGFRDEAVPVLWPHAFVTAVAVGDLDGDARAELVVAATTFEGARARGHLDVYRRAPDGTWSRRPLARREGRVRFEAITIGDLDGDGRRDVAAAGPEGTIDTFLGTRDGSFVRESLSLPSPGQCAAAAVIAADLDADRRDDLVVAYAQERSTATPTCPSEGALRAWRSAAPRSAAPRSAATGSAAPRSPAPRKRAPSASPPTPRPPARD